MLTYRYEDPDWGDMLTGINGNAITYDEIGNMLTFGGRTFTWEHGRQLASQTVNGSTWTYDYNLNDGMRTGRTNGSISYEYVYNGSQLMQMTRNGIVVDFSYINGIPATISFNGNTFYYVVNGQGDVTAITDSQGNILITYYYDAWGSPYCTYNSATSPYAQSLFDLNPFRYRGYVYDWEVGLYYLQSRYYIPDVARFLNADALISTGQGFAGNNMFVYCLNNPVNFVDSTGYDPAALQWWIGGMGWLPFSDGLLPIGEVIYAGGIIILGGLALSSSNQIESDIFSDEETEYYSPSPNINNDDDDDYDDYYYDDDNNFGGRQKIGKSKGSAPGNNQAQNKQFKDATKELSKEVKNKVHQAITGKGLGFHDIVAVVEEFLTIGLFIFGIGD